MCKSKIKKILVCGALSMGVIASTCASAFAADSPTAKGFGSELKIDAKATTVNVTVPGEAPFIFNENGTNVTPSSWTIENKSAIGGIYLDSVKLDAKQSGWTLLADSADLTKQSKDLKKIKLKVGKAGHEKLVTPTNGSDDSTGLADFNKGDINLEASGKETLNFVIERGAFTSDVANSTAFNMTLNFEFQ